MLEWDVISVDKVPSAGTDKALSFVARLHYWDKQAHTKALDQMFNDAVKAGLDPVQYALDNPGKPEPADPVAYAKLKLERDKNTGSLGVTEVTVSGDDVTAVLLRSLPISKVTTKALGLLELLYGKETVSDVGEIVVTADDRKQWPRGDKKRVSRLVTKIFTKATDMNIPPIPEIAKKFEVSNRTASRMVAYSREIGDLPPVP
ncbi:hypothetical protein [Corynebacterium sp.]|uniref:hypothetical protein n=1 Tax=Corynebacterium sp. TaxID=1720 RepID=UPI0028AE4DD3|nr:hypothetical protein [Corynebacterium sp.]